MKSIRICPEPVQQLSLGNPSLYHPKIVEKFGRLGNDQDLYKLRQISQLYYGFLNHTYLDYEKLSLYVNLDSTPDERYIDIQISSKDYLNPKDYIITLSDPAPPWSPQVGKMIRELHFCGYWDYVLEDIIAIPGTDMTLFQLISQISSSITVLELEQLPTRTAFRKPKEDLLKFFSQFQNLKRLKTQLPDYDDLVNHRISLKGLEPVFKSLCSRNKEIQISIELFYDPETIIFACRSLLQEFHNFDITVYAWFLSELSQPLRFQLQLPKDFLTNAKNIKFIFYISVDSVDELQTLASFCHKFPLEIQKLEVDLFFGHSNDLMAIRTYLSQLSPFVTGLYVSLSKEDGTEQGRKLDLFGTETNWPKLKRLYITRYAHPLTILKRCPNLKELRLNHIAENFCIFYEPGQTHEEALKSYFSNLPNLKYFSIRVTQKNNPIMNQRESKVTLKKLLPQAQVKPQRTCASFSPRRRITSVYIPPNQEDVIVRQRTTPAPLLTPSLPPTVAIHSPTTTTRRGDNLCQVWGAILVFGFGICAYLNH